VHEADADRAHGILLFRSRRKQELSYNINSNITEEEISKKILTGLPDEDTIIYTNLGQILDNTNITTTKKQKI